MTTDTLDSKLQALREGYPEQWRWYVDKNAARFAWQAEQVKSHVGSLQGSKIVDIGAGFSPCAPLLALGGANITIVDDFDDVSCHSQGTDVLENRFREWGVDIISGDVFAIDLPFEKASLDVVMTFDSLEHWHNSPKKLLHNLFSMLRPGGLLFIGVPNSVNLRKRVTAPFGRYKWSTMEQWYETEIFRGHVREPDVSDLQYIAQDLGARTYNIVGKNWIGYRSPKRYVRLLTPVSDRALQRFPAMCSDIYLLAIK